MKNCNMILTEKQQNICIIIQRQIIEQAKLAYSPLGKAFEKQRRTIEDQGIKQIEALKALKAKEDLKTSKPEKNLELESTEDLIPKNMRTNGNKNEIDEIRNGKRLKI